MYSKFLTNVAMTAAVVMSAQANAGLMLETYGSGAATPEIIGGYAMTDFAVTNGVGGVSSTTTSPLGGSLEFKDHNGDALDMNRGLANSTNWWMNGEATDNDIFTTGVHWVEIFLPENTRAFSFNVGASFSGRGWLEASEDGVHALDRTNFLVSASNTPGFGIYADNSGGECGSISSVIIDPSQWGVGNFSINQSECVTEVPEPGALGLIGLGVLGLGLARRRAS